MAVNADELTLRCRALLDPWKAFAAAPAFERFVEFAVAVSAFTEFLSSRSLAGLHQEAHALEQNVLTYFEAWSTSPPGPEVVSALGRRLSQFEARVAAFIEGNTLEFGERRSAAAGQDVLQQLQAQRGIGLVTDQAEHWSELIRQLRYFNIPTMVQALAQQLVGQHEATTVLVDHRGRSPSEVAQTVRMLRGHLAASCLIACEVPPDFDSQKSVLAAGCDYCFVAGTAHSVLIDRIMRVSEVRDEDPYRVLVVEDSRTAAAMIQRTLSEASMQATVIHDPRQVLDALQRVTPDLVLMDMHMPGCNGVEVTRVLRQHPEFLSTPVVYLSGDSDIALQVDALRLGGDHFLTKPFNPVILNAVIKSKIERYRALRKHMVCDSLTGLLNHTTCKQRLDGLAASAVRGGAGFCVAMVDIDHFKRVNDSYGHPAGDQVIRSMAWLVKQRLRTTDVVGRYGGEEFVLMLPDSTEVQVAQLLNAIREDFACIVHEAGEKRFQCSFSAGVAQWQTGDSADAVLACADERLYQAKTAGRNRVAVSPTIVVPA
ncbi:diguanylate cyclase [Curvibacter sp. APW13]|uniref:GGDEF domain-containing response regulator n=1 Tax=Curvibacter sp. APW13 TaxID=3077236 RepID=UPI0028DE23BC|nr:diguanylate cyclase [Curvibacter sp. APW13]MDT8991876.1 diguanylate cyclase [Curvibacter sp. APW13]